MRKLTQSLLVGSAALCLILFVVAGMATGTPQTPDVPLTQVESLTVEKHLLAVENAKLRLELLEAEGLKILSQLYQSHGLSQKTHDFVGFGFRKKPQQAVMPDGSAGTPGKIDH